MEQEVSCFPESSGESVISVSLFHTPSEDSDLESPQGRMEPVQVAPRIKMSELIRYSEEHEKRSTDWGLSQSGRVKKEPG